MAVPSLECTTIFRCSRCVKNVIKIPRVASVGCRRLRLSIRRGLLCTEKNRLTIKYHRWYWNGTEQTFVLDWLPSTNNSFWILGRKKKSNCEIYLINKSSKLVSNTFRIVRTMKINSTTTNFLINISSASASYLVQYWARVPSCAINGRCSDVRRTVRHPAKARISWNVQSVSAWDYLFKAPPSCQSI